MLHRSSTQHFILIYNGKSHNLRGFVIQEDRVCVANVVASGTAGPLVIGTTSLMIDLSTYSAGSSKVLYAACKSVEILGNHGASVKTLSTVSFQIVRCDC